MISVNSQKPMNSLFGFENGFPSILNSTPLAFVNLEILIAS